MAILELNRYQTYLFQTSQEEKTACILSEGNLQNIRNQMVSAINERLGLELDMTNPHRFIQQEASLTGQIKAFQFLIDLHEDTITQIKSEDSPV